MRSAEELANEYLKTLPLGTYGKEFDAFMAGYIACLEHWKWSDYDRQEDTVRPNDTNEVSGLNVPVSRPSDDGDVV
jgi:hypothetical protein